MLKWKKKHDSIGKKIFSKKQTATEVVRSCETCGEELVSVYTSVGEKFYHPDCLLCSICGVKIDEEFFLEDGEILCENDYDKVPHPFIMSIDPNMICLIYLMISSLKEKSASLL